jgi:hypothetical protein
MRINQFNPGSTHLRRSSRLEDNAQSKPEGPVPVTAQDMLLLRRIERDENLLRVAHGIPWATTAMTSAVWYMVSKSIPQAGWLGLPIGLLLGSGIAESWSDRIQERIAQAEAQLSSNQPR